MPPTRWNPQTFFVLQLFLWISLIFFWMYHNYSFVGNQNGALGELQSEIHYLMEYIDKRDAQIQSKNEEISNQKNEIKQLVKRLGEAEKLSTLKKESVCEVLPNCSRAPAWCQEDDGSFGIVFSFTVGTPEVTVYSDRYNNTPGGRIGYYLIDLSRALLSIKQVSPKTKIAIITDFRDLPKNITELVDHVIVHSWPLKFQWHAKFPSLFLSPFHRTLFLDSDILVCDDLNPMFDYIRHHDMAFTREPFMLKYVRNQLKAPEEFTYPSNIQLLYFNAGVLMYRKSPHLYDVFDKWYHTIREKNNDMNTLTEK